VVHTGPQDVLYDAKEQIDLHSSGGEARTLTLKMAGGFPSQTPQIDDFEAAFDTKSV